MHNGTSRRESLRELITRSAIESERERARRQALPLPSHVIKMSEGGKGVLIDMSTGKPIPGPVMMKRSIEH